MVVGAPRHSWLRAPGAVPRHSWLGSAGGGGVWSLATPGCGSRLRFAATPGWGVRWWRWWVGPCHSWLRVSGAVPRHSWLGSAGRGGGCSRGCGFPVLCVLVARRVRVVSVLVCVVCVPGVCVGGGAGVGVPSACVCVCVCVRVWCVGGVRLPALASSGCCCVGGGVAGVCCGRSLATPGGGSCVRFPATPGWGPPVVVGVPRHSWLRAPGAVPRHSWLGSAGGGGVRLPATAGWGLPVAVGCFLGGGVPCCVCLWCVWLRAVAVLCCVLRVCGVRVAGGVVWRCGGCVFRVRWCAWLRVCGVPVVRGLLSPPLLVGAWGWCLCDCGWCVVWVPRHSWLRDLGAVPRHSWLGSAVVRWWLVPCHSWLRGLVAGPRHSWLGSAAGCCGWSLATPGRGPWAWFPATPCWGPLVVVVGARSPLLAVGPGVPFSLALVCVCVLCGASCWCGWRAGVVRGVVAVCVCVCVRAVCGLWGVSYLGWFSSSVGMVVAKKQKKSKEEVL